MQMTKNKETGMKQEELEGVPEAILGRQDEKPEGTEILKSSINC